MDNILKQLEEKYQSKGQDPLVFLQGLLHAKPINYWDYIEVDSLLSLQKPKTEFKDEFIFIVYHQITELVLRLIVHELEQLTESPWRDAAFAEEKMGRLTRYTDLLVNSFSIMNKGMSREEYSQFRLSLAPASGFQSAQFRKIELFTTHLDNLIHHSRKKDLPENLAIAEKFNYLYWQEAGYDRKTGNKTVTLKEFEDRYLAEFVEIATRMKDKNLICRAMEMEEKGMMTASLKESLRNFDHTYNVAWPMVHLQTAHTYLGSGKAETAATGGSQWEKYLHPKFQRRIFFPFLWSEEELENWGN